MQFAKCEINFTTMEGKCIEKAEGLTINKFYRLEPIGNGMYKVYNDNRSFGMYPKEIFQIPIKHISYVKTY